MIRLYWFYNIEAEMYGKPFAMCDKHVKGYAVPGCILVKMADNPTEDWQCSHPDHRKPNKTKGKRKV